MSAAIGYEPSDDARSRLMLVRLTISQWSGRKYDRGASDDVARVHGLGGGDSADVGRFNKILVDPETIRPVRHALKKLQNEHYRLTAPWMGEGTRVLTAPLYFDYTETIRKLRGDADAAVARFARRDYPREREDARSRLGDLFCETDYPAPEEIEGRFGARVRVEPLPDPDDARLLDLGATDAAAIAGDVRASMEEAIAEAHRSVVDELARRAREFVAKVRKYGSGETRGLRATALTNLLETVDLVRRGLNVAGDPALDEVALQVNGALRGLSVETLRGDEDERRARTKAVEDVLGRFAGVFSERGS